MSLIEERLSEQFNQWEQRGRGWQVFSEPVHPEPPFRPFYGHVLPAAPVVDDGRRPTFLSSLVERLSRKLSTQPVEAPETPEPEEEPVPELLIREPLVELQTSLPAKLDIGRDAFEQFLRNLSFCREPVSFELLGTPGRVSVQFALNADDSSIVRRQLQAYFSDATFLQREGSLSNAWETCSGEEILVVEFGLAREFMFSLQNGKIDPFVGIIAALSELQAGELALFQVIFESVKQDWSESIVRSVTHSDGKPFFVNMPELASAAEQKVAGPLYAAVVRVAVKSDSFDRTLEIARDVAGSLRVFADPQSNELIPLSNDEYPFEDHIADVLCRQSRRTGMLLSSDELIGFVHLPSSDIRSSVLERNTEKSKAAPSIVLNPRGILLGTNFHNGQSIPVRLTAEQRVRHMHVIGASGTGKSTLLYNLITQDIENGHGVAVLDPHGDLIDRILGAIPAERIDDVVLVDPSDPEYSVGFNILTAHSDLEKNLLASDLVSVFERLSTSWGDQMNSVLQNAILAFLESSRGGTVADVRRFLIEPAYRNEFLTSVEDSEVVYYWQKSFPHLSGGKSIGSILTRLDALLAQKPIRHMVSQVENRLDFARIMDGGQIFLAKLPEGLLGKQNSHLLGSLLVSKFQQIAMSRQATRVESRRDFWLYIDEFANFITPTMAEILVGARKYRIGLTLAHHELHQLQKNPDVASAVMSHPFTRIVFRVGDEDARKLGDGFAYFESHDLRNLETGRAVCRVQRSDYDFNLTVPLPVAPNKAQADVRRREVITASRKKYARVRAEIESTLRKKLAPTVELEPSPAPPVPPPVAAIPIPDTVETPREPDAKPRDADSGDTDHTAIKNLISHEAESLDYTASIEELVPSGGRIDVVLRRGTRAIACEVSVTNTVGYEAENILKCIQAGFSTVAVISRSSRKLLAIKSSLGDRASTANATVGFYSPEEFLARLFEWAAEDPAGAVIEREKPRKRTITLGATAFTESERKLRENEMLEKLRQTMKQPGKTGSIKA